MSPGSVFSRSLDLDFFLPCRFVWSVLVTMFVGKNARQIYGGAFYQKHPLLIYQTCMFYTFYLLNVCVFFIFNFSNTFFKNFHVTPVMSAMSSGTDQWRRQMKSFNNCFPVKCVNFFKTFLVLNFKLPLTMSQT